MTIYNTYQEAKIAHPESDIASNGTYFVATEQLKVGDGFKWQVCNPADYCISVEKFLADGYEFAVGDLYISLSLTVECVQDEYFCELMNEPEKHGNNRYVLRAAALENTKPSRIKVSYEKVTESIFDLREEFESGELYQLTSKSEYRKIKNTECLAACLKYGSVHRKVETPITEREAFIEDAFKIHCRDELHEAKEVFAAIYDELVDKA